MGKLHKLKNNLLSPRAPSVLGWIGYARLVLAFVGRFPAIAKRGDLRPLDQAMGELDTFRYGERAFRFDCAFADRVIHDGSFAFGIVREILIRDCYLKYLPAGSLSSIDTVLDLGANRGVFSMLGAAFANKVLSVEANPDFRPVIEHNARINGFNHISVESVLVGTGGVLGASKYRKEDLSSLLDRHRIEIVDLMKMDIEGSEFALFEDDGWLRRVRRLCMEVHPRHGEPAKIVDSLRAHGFTMAFADGDLRRVGPEQEFEYLYAWC